MDPFDGLLRDTLIVTAVLTLPVLIAGALAGTIVAVAQAATQVQEQTLTMLPKLLAVGVVLACGGRFGFTLCAQLFREAVRAMMPLVRG